MRSVVDTCCADFAGYVCTAEAIAAVAVENGDLAYNDWDCCKGSHGAAGR